MGTAPFNTDDLVKEYVEYDPDIGSFIWIKRRRRVTVGMAAGSVNAHGYLHIRFNGQFLKAHRVAWFLFYGVWPDQMLDHINGERADNRIANLRLATPTQNSANRGANVGTGKLKGTRFQKGKWEAYVGINGRFQYLGRYPTELEAHAAHVAASKETYGEFARE